MTRPVTFGDLLDSAVRHLNEAGHVPVRPRGLDLPDIARSMHALAGVLRRQLSEIVSPDQHLSVSAGRRLRASEPQLSRHWQLAARRAHQAAIASAKNLEIFAAVPGSAGPAASEAGQHVDAAALSLRGAVDLLHSHLALPFADPMREMVGWTTAVRSPAVRKALIAELALVARHAAAVGTATTGTPAPAGRVSGSGRPGAADGVVLPAGIARRYPARPRQRASAGRRYRAALRDTDQPDTATPAPAGPRVRGRAVRGNHRRR